MTRERPLSITGLGSCTRDAITMAGPERIAALLAALPPAGLVALAISDDARRLHQRFARENGSHGWTPGGTVPNTLCALAWAQREHADTASELTWRGPAEYGDSVWCDVALAHLREWGIVPYPAFDPRFRREAYCIVNRETRDVARIEIYELRCHVERQPHWQSVDLAILTLADLVNADPGVRGYLQGCGRVAVLIADWRPHPGGATAERCLQDVANLAFLLGRREDFGALGLIDDSTARVVPALAKVECIGTNAAESVTWKGSGTTSVAEFPVSRVARPRGTFLGAGDAYAGAFLGSRLAGASAEEAHAAGTVCAAHVIDADTSYAPRSLDLNRVFPSRIDRRSGSSHEGELARRLHASPGLVVTSCGQTGVDQLGGQAARSLGLATFAIMPQGRRTEWTELRLGGPDRLSGLTILELASGSYRFCTWANVYASDGTLLVDYSGSEGSEETRRAAAWLGRPLLELAAIDPLDVAGQMRHWIHRHGIRVVNCAGNRRSVVGDDNFARAAAALATALRAGACAVALRDSAIPPMPGAFHPRVDEAWDRTTIAVPNSAVWRDVMGAFLRDIGMLEGAEADGLGRSAGLRWAWADNGLHVVFGRPRDLPAALRAGWADYAVFGQDVWLEDGEDVMPLFPVGLEPCALVEMARRSPLAPRAEARAVRVASAWPKTARRLVAGRYESGEPEIVPLSGSAEGWLAEGRVDTAVDTYHSGQSVEANHLEVHARFGTVHTWVHTRARVEAHHPITRALAAWLHGARAGISGLAPDPRRERPWCPLATVDRSFGA